MKEGSMNTLNEFDLLIYNTAVEAAMKAGELIKTQYHEFIAVETEFAHDLKLDIDRKAEKAIIDIIESHYSDHSIITEEDGIKVKSGEYCWIIDPLDGSVNYYYGLPYFCTCIACYKISPASVSRLAEGKKMGNPGEPVAGVVFSPVSSELYTAFKGKGAFRNGVRLSADTKRKLSEVIVIMSTGSTPDIINKSLCIANKFALCARKVRMFGATGLDIVNVASGTAGVFIQKGTNLWDFAASRVILEEAGGEIKYIETDAGKWDVVASNPAISGEVDEILKSCGFYED
ncbi:MAG TPA: hypothetical protein DC057_05880 [Spirochaetia bacterium]|nr:hypothetical protein [Spirochaetia bacterium]